MTLLWVVLAVVAMLAAAAVIARRGAAAQRRDNEVVPGVPTGAPISWAGAHTEEARLHRRLRDAVRALRAAPGGADESMRASLEHEAVEVDRRLVAVAALGGTARSEALGDVAAAVDALERTVASAVTSTRGLGQPVVEELAERLRALEEARAELDEAERGGGQAQPG